jgi:RNA recognition motif-containing protein
VRTILYVSNVGHSADLSMLEDLFLTVGDVTTQRLELIPESGHSMEFGIFEMSTEQQAADCVERFNGLTINGKQLAIVSERPKLRPVIAKSKRESRRVL